SYHFTSSNDQGAILILPEGSSLSRLENKAIFRDYAKKHALAWFKYAKKRRGREFPSGTDPSLYLVTGCEKCPAWGSNGSPSPLICFHPERVATDIYSWGRSGPYESRCHPTHKFSGQPLPNQTVFVRGFKISKKSKKVLKVRDITGTRVKAEQILDLSLGMSAGPNAGTGTRNASRASNDQGHASSGGRHRTMAPAGGLGNDDMDVDDSSLQEASP
ncbi:hypothetical protein MPER_00839, partial [Moniliophthora perniciosa FA553]